MSEGSINNSATPTENPDLREPENFRQWLLSIPEISGEERLKVYADYARVKAAQFLEVEDVRPISGVVADTREAICFLVFSKGKPYNVYLPKGPNGMVDFFTGPIVKAREDIAQEIRQEQGKRSARFFSLLSFVRRGKPANQLSS